VTSSLFFSTLDNVAVDSRERRSIAAHASDLMDLVTTQFCTTWAVAGKHVYLLSLLRDRLDYPSLKRAVRELLSVLDRL
jgi:hypothetical protein